MNKIYQKAIDNRIQYHSKQINEIKKLNDSKPVWSEPRKLFKRKHGKSRFEPFGVPTGTLGVYRIIYEPSGETMYVGRGVGISGRLSRHRMVFLNKGKDVINPGGTSLPSAVGQHMYKFDTHRKNWLFSWCSIGNISLSKEYEDLSIKFEKPLFSSEYHGGN